MNLYRSTLIVALLALLLGCTVELPSITSATATYHESGRPNQTAILSPEAQAKVTQWFAEHRSGWSRSYVSYAPAIELRILGRSGELVVVNLIGQKVVVYGSFGQFEQSFATTQAMSMLLSAISDQVANR